MTFSEDGKGNVTLTMRIDDYANLLVMLGIATGEAMREGELDLFWRRMQFVNNLNAGNPRFAPYEVPEKFAGRR